jgi:hypothetical protein
VNTAADPLEGLRSAIQATQSEIRNAVAALEAVRPALDDRRVAERLNDTLFAGHAALAIRSACVSEALLAAARLWDKRKDSAIVRRVVAELREPAVRCALAALHAEMGAASAEPRLEGVIRISEAFLSRAEASFARLKPIRDKGLAHRDLSERFHADGGAAFPEPEFDILLRCADLIARRAQRLLGERPQPFSWRAERRSRREDGVAFWHLIVDAPPASLR